MRAPTGLFAAVLVALCAQSVRDERQGAAPAGGVAGCGKDTDCKGERIYVRGACVDRQVRAADVGQMGRSLVVS